MGGPKSAPVDTPVHHGIQGINTLVDSPSGAEVYELQEQRLRSWRWAPVLEFLPLPFPPCPWTSGATCSATPIAI